MKGNTTISFSIRLGAFQLFSEPLGGLVQMRQFRFFVSLPNNISVENVTVYFGDGINETRTVPQDPYPDRLEFTHIYQTVGKFVARMTGVGSTFSESASFPEPLEVEGSVDDLKLQIPPTVHHPPGVVTANVYLARSQHQIMNMTCKMNWDEILDSTLGTWSGSLQPTASFPMSFTYLTLGVKELVLNCSNPYSNISLSAYVFVNNECFSPDPIFDRQFAKYHKPMVVLQSVKVKLVTRTVILCTTHKPRFVWSISVYSPNGARLSSYTNFQQPKVDYLIIEPGELEPGLYRMALNISFGAEYKYCWLWESIFVKMERPPLVAEIQGGRIRKTGKLPLSISTPGDPEAIIDARTGSYDPIRGYGISDGLVFSWNCSVYHTATVEDLMNLAKQSSPGDPQPCDDISKEIVEGKRQLVIEQNVKAIGFMFEVCR
ncbi:hypothetical protein C0Q70_01115 [Pomacea canaliculata]|uniref:PKD/REJ-like domain-containing protein n=1 Tax=Pomacea canaliculata TaxID=400727 RepID=A0A2T7PYM0_POMCA|nr:hypothetical protein C0Q70_01115 [Pomacea canaliculata]